MGKYVSIDHLGIAYLRVDFPDLYADFLVMAERAFEHWGDHMDGGDRFVIEDTVDRCIALKRSAVEHSTRIYVTTEYVYPHLVMVDTPDHVVEHMIESFEFDHLRDLRWKEYLDCVVLWVFRGDRLITHLPINPGALAQLVTAFYPENLIARDHLRMNWNLQVKSWQGRRDSVR